MSELFWIYLILCAGWSGFCTGRQIHDYYYDTWKWPLILILNFVFMPICLLIFLIRR